MNIGAVIRAERKKKRYGLVEFSKMVGLSTAGLARIETGLVQGKKETLHSISEALGLPLEYLVVASIEGAHIDAKEKEAFEQFRQAMLDLLERS